MSSASRRIAHLDMDAERYKLYPVVQLGVSYRF